VVDEVEAMYRVNDSRETLAQHEEDDDELDRKRIVCVIEEDAVIVKEDVGGADNNARKSECDYVLNLNEKLKHLLVDSHNLSFNSELFHSAHLILFF
jgi:hypothetical protein